MPCHAELGHATNHSRKTVRYKRYSRMKSTQGHREDRQPRLRLAGAKEREQKGLCGEVVLPLACYHCGATIRVLPLGLCGTAKSAYGIIQYCFNAFLVTMLLVPYYLDCTGLFDGCE